VATTLNLYDQWRDIAADPTRAAAVAGTLKAAIVTAAYTLDQNLHDFWDDVSANEVSGTNYTAWLQHASGFSNGRRVIVYYDTGTGSTSRLVGYSNDFGADSGNVAGDFSVAFDAAGIYTSPR
jgi:hypothetical protein